MDNNQNNEKKEMGTFKTVLTIDSGLVDNHIIHLWEDLYENLWIGTWGGVHRLDVDGKLSPVIPGLTDNRIRFITGDRKGNIWIGTENGLNRVLKNNNRIEQFTRKDGLIGNSISFVFEDNREVLWVGTDKGIHLIKDGVVEMCTWSATNKTKEYYCAYQDKLGNLWFGGNSGLIRHRLVDGKWKTNVYTKKEGLIENNVFSVMEDAIGFLWLSGRNGVSRIPIHHFSDFSQGRLPKLPPQCYN